MGYALAFDVGAAGQLQVRPEAGARADQLVLQQLRAQRLASDLCTVFSTGERGDGGRWMARTDSGYRVQNCTHCHTLFLQRSPTTQRPFSQSIKGSPVKAHLNQYDGLEGALGKVDLPALGALL
jgi:hypothetical protein